MTNAINRQTKQIMLNLNDVSRLDPNEWIIGFDMEPLNGVSMRYWKIQGDNVVVMNKEEQEAVNSEKRKVLVKRKTVAPPPSPLAEEKVSLEPTWKSIKEIQRDSSGDTVSQLVLSCSFFTSGKDAAIRIMDGTELVAESLLPDSCDTWQNFSLATDFKNEKTKLHHFIVEGACATGHAATVTSVTIALFRDAEAA